MAQKFDVLITNAQVLDGARECCYRANANNPWFRADIGISNGKIAQIGHLGGARTKKTIDASGLVVAPGFIDIHTHTDDGLANRDLKANLNYLKQGVTTVVAGNCGGSPFPIKDWFDTCKLQGIGTNALMLVGEGTIREKAMGGIFNRPPTPQELSAMKALVAQAMKEGAVGMSTGLEYPPGIYTTTEELIELAKIVAEYGGIYASHMRNQDTHLVEGVAEAIKVSEESGCHGQVSHLKAIGQANWGTQASAINLIEAARERGVDVVADQYPYTAGATGGAICLPQWVFEGGNAKLLKRLQDPQTREKIRNEMIAGPFGWWPGWDKVVVASVKVSTQYIGMPIQQVADSLGKDPYYTFFDLLIAEQGEFGAVFHFMSEKDICDIMVKPWVLICSDGSTTAFEKGKPHPRNYGSFPRVLGKYVREDGLLTLEDAIRKMTSQPAQALFLRDRGLIREGHWADITIFDPLTVKDLATYDNPHQYNEGIKHVLVNGIVTIEEGEFTGFLAGKPLNHYENKRSES